MGPLLLTFAGSVVDVRAAIADTFTTVRRSHVGVGRPHQPSRASRFSREDVICRVLRSHLV